MKNKYEKTGVKVTFQDVGFRVLSPGNLREVELDNALDTLYNRVLNQENTQLNQLELCSRAFESLVYCLILIIFFFCFRNKFFK